MKQLKRIHIYERYCNFLLYYGDITNIFCNIFGGNIQEAYMFLCVKEDNIDTIWKEYCRLVDNYNTDLLVFNSEVYFRTFNGKSYKMTSSCNVTNFCRADLPNFDNWSYHG